jgi:hypothetical protein
LLSIRRKLNAPPVPGFIESGPLELITLVVHMPGRLIGRSTRHGHVAHAFRRGLSPWQPLFTYISSPDPRAAHDFCRQHSFAKRKYLSTSLLILAIASTRPHSLYLFVADSNHGWPVPAISVRCATRPLQLQSQGRHHGQPPATSSAEEEARRASHRVQQAPRQLFDSTIWQYERQADAQEDKDLCQGCAMDSARFPSVHATRRSGCFVVRHFHSRRYGHRRLYHEDTGKIQ